MVNDALSPVSKAYSRKRRGRATVRISKRVKRPDNSGKSIKRQLLYMINNATYKMLEYMFSHIPWPVSNHTLHYIRDITTRALISHHTGMVWWYMRQDPVNRQQSEIFSLSANYDHIMQDPTNHSAMQEQLASVTNNRRNMYVLGVILGTFVENGRLMLPVSISNDIDANKVRKVLRAECLRALRSGMSSILDMTRPPEWDAYETQLQQSKERLREHKRQILLHHSEANVPVRILHASKNNRTLRPIEHGLITRITRAQCVVHETGSKQSTTYRLCHGVYVNQQKSLELFEELADILSILRSVTIHYTACLVLKYIF